SSINTVRSSVLNGLYFSNLFLSNFPKNKFEKYSPFKTEDLTVLILEYLLLELEQYFYISINIPQSTDLILQHTLIVKTGNSYTFYRQIATLL
ncbi:MAG: hypothetical protein Q8893_02635, partial [Candidatus Phytoplasma australasiaticum]|nr:hypothetical protein [Candidatus Phytoplasma australasiaticum]